jgi:DNA-binding beta-propeller fold protein YncE
MRRRDFLIAGAAAMSSGCGPKRGTGFPGYALVATSGEQALAAVDLTAFRLVKSVPLCASPTAVIASQSSSYALTPSNGSVHRIDADLKRVAYRKLADELSEIRLTADGKRLLAISAKSAELIEADTGTLAPLKRYKLKGQPVSLDLSSSGRAAVSTGVGGSIELVDLASGEHNVLDLSGPIGAVRFRADGQLLLVANLKGQSITALEVPSLRTVADLPLAMQPENLCFTADQGQLFVSGRGMDGVAIVFPYGILEVDQTLLAGSDPGVMACSGLPSNLLFVGSNSGSDLSILSVDTRRAIAMVEVGQKSTFITVTPGNEYALVLDEVSGSLAVIYIPAIHWNRERLGAALFTVLPVGQRPVHAAVVPASQAA